jgi:DNA-binding beta-propeller fold protein YncE
MSRLSVRATYAVFVITVLVLGGSARSSNVLAHAEQDGRELWMTAQDLGEVKVLRANTEVASIPLGFGTSPHFVRFPADGAYAYVSALGDGAIYVIRANQRHLVATIPIAPATEFKGNINPALPGGGGVHDATPSPDGTIVLAAHWGTNRLYKVLADEKHETWTVDSSIDILGRRPICSVFHPELDTAYVGLAPNGLAVVDVASMTVLHVYATDAAIPCTMQTSTNRTDGYLVTTTGRFYHMNLWTNVLTDLGDRIVAPHIHSLVLPANGPLVAASRDDDTLRLIDAIGSEFASIPVDPTIGIPDKPDTVAAHGNHVFVALRATGKLGIVNLQRRTTRYVDIALPSVYAVHGLAVRPCCEKVENHRGRW